MYVFVKKCTHVQNWVNVNNMKNKCVFTLKKLLLPYKATEQILMFCHLKARCCINIA